MLGSAVFYLGVVAMCAGVALTIRPIARLRVPTRRRAIALAGGGLVVAGCALLSPAFETQAHGRSTHLDAFAPTWQFHEVHSRRIAAPPADVFAAIRHVRADEILLFRTLTWIRRGGRPLPPGILNPEEERPIVDVALNGGFILLANDAPRELLLGAVVAAPPGAAIRPTPEIVRHPPPGYSVAAMNFLVSPDGRGGSILVTETRVVSSDAAARRRFAKYWRVIYPGSALIRRMWLRAIDRRATQSL